MANLQARSMNGGSGRGYLTEGGVSTTDLIETWISLEREQEIAPVNLRPHPYEFSLYYDV